MKVRAVVFVEAFGANAATGIAYDYGADAGLGVFGGRYQSASCQMCPIFGWEIAPCHWSEQLNS